MTFGRWFELVWVSWVMEFGCEVFAAGFCQSLGTTFAGHFPPSLPFVLPPQVAAKAGVHCG